MPYESIDEIIDSIRSTTRDIGVSRAEEEAGLGPPEQGEKPAGRRWTTLSGIGESITGAFSKGAETFGEELTAPMRDIPEAAETLSEATAPAENLTVLDRLRRVGNVGLGVAQAGLSPFRTLNAPFAAAARTAVELPSMLAEYPDVPRSEHNETGRKIAQGLVELAMGVAAPSAIAKFRALSKAKKLGSQGTTSGRLLTGATDEPLQLPGIGETSPPTSGEGAPTRIFQAGPPGSVKGKPTVAETPGLTAKDIAWQANRPREGRFGVPPAEEAQGTPRTILGRKAMDTPVTEAKTKVPQMPRDVAPLDVEVPRGPLKGGPKQSALDMLRERASEALDQSPRIVDDILKGATESSLGDDATKSLGQRIREGVRKQREAAEQGTTYINRDPTTAEYFPGGKPADMSLRDWVKLHHGEELKKVRDVATNPNPAVAQAAPPHIQQAVNSGGVTPNPDQPDWLTTLFTRAKIRLPFSMTHIVKNDPVMKEIHQLFVNGNDAVQVMRDKWTSQIRDIAKKVSKADFEAGIGARDKRLPPANPNQGQVATLFGKIADEWAAALSLDPTHPDFVKNYVPRLRQAFKVVKTEIQATDDWVSRDVLSHFPKNFRPYFTQHRKLDLPGDNYSLDTMIGHSNAVARASVYGTPQHHGILNDLEPLLKRLKDRPADVQEFMAAYINHAIGHPQFRSSEMMQKFGGFTRTLEFARTIGANVTSPIYNTMQRALTFSEVGVKAWGQGIKDEIAFYKGSPAHLDLLKKAKVPVESLGPHKYETETVTEGAQKVLNWTADKLAMPFGYAERGNRVHAFFSGYRDALNKGANEAEALIAGRNMVHKTQFMPGPADKPSWMRGEVGNTLGQFKYFQTKLGEYVWGNLSDIAKRGATPQERVQAAGKFLRFWGTAYALGGPQTVPIIGDALDKMDPVGWKGIAPYLGIAVRDQLGLGTLMPESLEALKYYIPGPAVNHVIDVVNAATGFDVWNPKTEPSVASRVRAGVRSVPIAGIQLERLRRGGLVNEQGEERKPQTVSEAFPPFMGGTGVDPRRPLIARDVSKVGRMVGFQDPEQEKSFRAMTVINDAAATTSRAKQDAAQALEVGDYKGAREILREAEKKLGLPPGRLTVSPQSKKASEAARTMTPLERRRKAAGKELRNYGMEDLLQ